MCFISFFSLRALERQVLRSVNCRFLSEDPLGLSGGDLTLYSYASNNPVVFSDPSGLCSSGSGLQGIKNTAVDYLRGFSETTGNAAEKLWMSGLAVGTVSLAAAPFSDGASSTGLLITEGVWSQAGLLSTASTGAAVTADFLSGNFQNVGVNVLKYGLSTMIGKTNATMFLKEFMGYTIDKGIPIQP